MPYIKDAERWDLDESPLESLFPQTPGHLNYAITVLVRNYLDAGASYQRYNDAVGALECAKLELYRRMIAPYEDVKIAANGDVYE